MVVSIVNSQINISIIVTIVNRIDIVLRRIFNKIFMHYIKHIKQHTNKIPMFLLHYQTQISINSEPRSQKALLYQLIIMSNFFSSFKMDIIIENL